MPHTYYSHGKLLISGEYAVLHGALALAVPLKYGHRMEITENHGQNFTWEAYHINGHWFSATFTGQLKLVITSDEKLAGVLQKILTEALRLAKKPASIIQGLSVKTILEFNPNWGWGSSSTLVQNLSAWLKIDPYELLAHTFGGSGYDIAAAGAETPIIYNLDCEGCPIVKSIPFSPPFIHKLGVVYLNRKQKSARAVRQFSSNNAFTQDAIAKISGLTRQMCLTNSEEEFKTLMHTHEKITGKLTGLKTLQERLFPDFKGAIKSMGAWGGDFALFLPDQKISDIEKYFQTKGYTTLFNLYEIKLNK